jgi:two-component system nitrate/nitrite response regulator NarL
MRIVLCDDHRLFVEPVAAALARRGHDVVVTLTPARALRAVSEHEPTVVLMDLMFPDASGIDAIRELRERRVACPVVVLSGSADAAEMSSATAAGATACLRKDQPVAAIFDAVERIAAGRSVAAAPLPRPRPPSDEYGRVHRLVARLTDREREVLRRLVEAQDTTEIARSMGVATSTARTHLQNVLLKLGVHSRLQAVALVVATGIHREL